MRNLLLGFCLVLLAGTAAQARPRDEAMARAYRCAGHQSLQVWLDCYYGAAQPVRAGLGMAAASPVQAQLSDAPISGGIPADTGLRDQVMADAARCAAVQEERRWLDCFYGATGPVRSRLGLAPLGAAAPVLASTAPMRPHAPVPARPAPQKRLPSFLPEVFGQTVALGQGRMTNYSYDQSGHFTVTLDNGQVWQQMSNDSTLSHWRKPAGRYQVTVANGAFGSNNLTVKGEAGIFKVELAR